MTPAPRRLAIALAISLLANMFLLGMIVSRLSAPGPHRAAEPDGMHGRRPMVAADARRHDRSLRHLLRPKRAAMRAEREGIRAARREVRDALVAEPFDTKALSTALAQLREATGHAQHALHEALLRAAPTLSADQRAQLSRAHRLWSGPPDRPGKRGGPRRAPTP